MTFYRFLTVFLAICLLIALFPLFIAAQTVMFYLFLCAVIVSCVYLALRPRK